MSRWRQRSSVAEADYDLLQPVLIQRCTLARLCSEMLAAPCVSIQLHSLFEDWAVAARKAARFQVRRFYVLWFYEIVHKNNLTRSSRILSTF